MGDIFGRLESEVRWYSRIFPAVFERASGTCLYDVTGRRYIDFLAGAGALNYGHNHPELKRALVAHIMNDGIVHALDLATSAKAEFLERFEHTILRPRELRYKVQFTGPTGADAIEAALKLVRKVSGRSRVISFTGAYHGVSMGALPLTSNAFYRSDRLAGHGDVAFMPFDGYLGPDINTLDYMRRVLTDSQSGVDGVAAVFVETVQAEGGVNVASNAWLRELQSLCREREILLVVDDIQAGCGRTGTFFSFEEAGLVPDVVALSKSISGFGLPMSLLLVHPALDEAWRPGEHASTFRGNSAALVTATEACRFWESPEWPRQLARSATVLSKRLQQIVHDLPQLGAKVRARGLIAGLDVRHRDVASAVRDESFRLGVVAETCGAGCVVKMLPPLNTPEDVLLEGLDIIARAAATVAARRTS